MAEDSAEATATFWNTVFDAVSAAMPHGPTLHLPSANMWFAMVRPGMLACHHAPRPPALCTCAAEALPFPDATFACAVGFDVLGRSPRPAHALVEAERVLVPGGRLVLVEPWTGLAGRLFFGLKRKRRTAADLDPWYHNGPGTAAAARTCLVDRVDELARHATALRVVSVTPLGGLGEVLASRDTPRPDRVARHMLRLSRLPPIFGRPLQGVLATRALCILERGTPPQE